MYTSNPIGLNLDIRNVKSDRPLIFILSGAGLSAESGIPTYRSNSNNWTRTGSVSATDMKQNPQAVFDNINQRIRLWSQAMPNAAHFAIADFKRKWKDKADIVHVTQNIDTLCEDAGDAGVFHLHGSFLTSRCTACGAVFPRLGFYKEGNCCPACKKSGLNVRPNVVFFEETPLGMGWVSGMAAQADVFLAVGTSCTVFPAAGLVRKARRSGCRNRILITEDINRIPGLGNPANQFRHFFRGSASVLLPEILEKMGRWIEFVTKNSIAQSNESSATTTKD